jgi:RimJ/RimL family protein N-acetyltransferase
MIPPIETRRLKLRTPAISDLPGYLAYRNEPASLASQMMDAIDEKCAEKFLSVQSQLEEDAAGWRMFSIERLESPALIGEVGIFIGVDDARQGDLGWWLHSDHRKQGYAVEAAKALIGWYFAYRGLHRVTAGCLSTNTASQHTMRTIGMRLESQSVESRFSAGRWHDEVGYALLRSEWEASHDERSARP